jgi:hypothetical protein
MHVRDKMPHCSTDIISLPCGEINNNNNNNNYDDDDDKSKTFKPNVAVCTQEVPGSNLGL